MPEETKFTLTEYVTQRPISEVNQWVLRKMYTGEEKKTLSAWDKEMKRINL